MKVVEAARNIFSGARPSPIIQNQVIVLNFSGWLGAWDGVGSGAHTNIHKNIFTKNRKKY